MSCHYFGTVGIGIVPLPVGCIFYFIAIGSNCYVRDSLCYIDYALSYSSENKTSFYFELFAELELTQRPTLFFTVASIDHAT